MYSQQSQIKNVARTIKSHPFVVPKFLQNSHIQTLLAGFIPFFTIPINKPEKKQINLSNGSKLIADCFFQKQWEDKATIVIFSGFEGYSNSGKSPFGQG